MLKKFTAVILSALLCVALVSCGGKTGSAIDFSGKTFDEVVDWSIKNNREDKITYKFAFDETVEAGKVVSQTVKAGESLENGIEILISNGKAPTEMVGGMVVVPNDIGKMFCDAAENCSSSGIDIGEISYIKCNLPVGTVLKTDPIPGSRVAFGEASVNFVCAEQLENSKKIELFVDWGEDNIETEKVTIKAQVEGKDAPDKTRTVDTSKYSTSLYFEAMSGKQQVTVTINDTVKKNYELDFDEGEYTEK